MATQEQMREWLAKLGVTGIAPPAEDEAENGASPGDAGHAANGAGGAHQAATHRGAGNGHAAHAGARPAAAGGATINHPHLTREQQEDAEADHGTAMRFFDAALQGTTGRQSKPDMAVKIAREVAEKAAQFLRAHPELEKGNPDFARFFIEALQGSAGKFDDPDKIVADAVAVSQQTDDGTAKLRESVEWEHATLPQPMAPDCQIVHGKVPGPRNHVLCGTHDHILDSDAGTVIAHNLDEYKKLFPKK